MLKHAVGFSSSGQETSQECGHANEPGRQPTPLQRSPAKHCKAAALGGSAFTVAGLSRCLLLSCCSGRSSSPARCSLHLSPRTAFMGIGWR